MGGGQDLRRAAIAFCGIACAKAPGSTGAGGADRDLVSAPSATAAGAPRPGMLWIPAGVLRAGSAPTEIPRVADAELPGVEVPMAGFYVDALPWPNEVGAIATTNLTREEAQRLCAGKAKRLCTELEWERACKGPDNARYEYGTSYDEHACTTGLAPGGAARRPSGEKTRCQSAFGVREMHGGAWEWTDSTWRRGKSQDWGVVRGGNDVAGEMVSRCAYARPQPSGERSPAIGFRCCAGPRNEPEVTLDVKSGIPLEREPNAPGHSPPLEALGGLTCGPPKSPSPCSSARAWTWRPEGNVELTLAGGCMGAWPETRCGLAVARTLADQMDSLAQVDTGHAAPDVVLVGGADRRIRVVGESTRGRFVREVTFSYGRIDVHDVR